MTFWGVVLLLVVAGVCGSLGMTLGGFSRGGCLVSIAVGLIGAVIGNLVATRFDLPDIFTIHPGGKPFPIVWTIIGSTAFVLVLRLLHRKRD